MRPSVFLGLLVLLTVASNINGQGMLVPRRHSPAKQSTPAAAAGTVDTGKESEMNPPAIPAGEPARKPAEPAVSSLPAALPVAAININLKISGQVATVTVSHVFSNDTDDLLEGTYYFPVPEGASLEEFAVYDGDERRTGKVKEKEQARADYAAAVAQGDDPAILEMTKSGWFQSHVYPIPPHSGKRVELIYSQVLNVKDGSVTFDYPLGQGYKKLKIPVGSVAIDVDLKSASAINNVFSPTHPLDVSYDGDRHATGMVKTIGGGEAENFRLSYSLSDADIGMTLITYRKQGQDGYFLLMLSPKVQFDQRRISAKDVVFVIDVSGSMNGSKIAQAKEALRFGLTHTLGENDRFNIISFSSSTNTMVPSLIQATPPNIAKAVEFVDKLKADGGTNINDALLTAMKMLEPGSRPKNLVFMTDGMPTVGQTNPDEITNNVRTANSGRVRLFAFGVGADVNKILLERLAADNRGAGSNIDNESQLGATMSGFFSKVSQPVLANLQVDFGPVQVDRVHPAELPDLYTRSQIKIMGRYRNGEDLKNVTVTLAGQMNEQPQQFPFSGLDFPLVTDDGASLPKLWASERVGALLAQIRLNGERQDLKQEVLDLANEFNLVTPYTSMYVPTAAELARERQERAQPVSSSLPATSPDPAPVLTSIDHVVSTYDAGIGPGSGRGVGSGSGNGYGNGGGNAVIVRKSGPADPRSAAKDSLSFNYGGGPAPGSGSNNGPGGSLPVNGRDSQKAPADQAAPPPGTIVDQTGAVVANATVTIKDKNTGATRTVTTDSTGSYSVAGLQPGTYDVEVDAPGFKKTSVQDVTVQPGQAATTGVQLSVASTSEMVTVAAASADIVNEDSAAVSQNVESRTIAALPNRQSMNTLALLTPGVAVQNQNNKGEQAQAAATHADPAFSIAGGRSGGANFTIDGQNNNDIGGRPTISPRDTGSVHSLQVLETAGFGDASRMGGSSLNVVTRSGSNMFHGSIFGFDLDRRWGAMSPLERRSGLAQAPAGTDQLFGFNLGGPIRRDRLFFFGSLQAEGGNSGLFSDSTASAITPTSLGLNQLLQAFPNSRTVLDLAARRTATDPLGNMSFFRTFVLPVLGVPVQFGEATRVMPSHTSGYQGSGRVDFNLTRRDTVRFNYWYQERRATGSVGRLSAGYADDLRETGQLGGVEWTRLLSPRSTNEMSIGFNRAHAALTGAQNGVISGSSIVVGLHGLDSGESPMIPESHLSTLFQAGDTITLSRGPHVFTFGAQVQRRITHLNFLSGPSEQFYYKDYDAFVLAQPFTLAVTLGNPGYPFSETGQYYFADDRWRITDHLTLSFGLAYQNSGQPILGLADAVRQRETGPAPLFDPALPPGLRTITKPDRNNHQFAPRIACAYNPRMNVGLARKIFGVDRTILRGGADISYDATDYQSLAAIQAGAPNTLTAVLGPSAAAQIARSGSVTGAGELRALIGSDPRSYSVIQVSPESRPPYAARWHFSVGRNLDDRITIEAAYLGARGFGLIRALDGMPQLTPAGTLSTSPALPGTVRIYDSSGQSIYHGLQTHADFRFAKNLTAGVSYTFSKLIDDVPDSIVSPGSPIGTSSVLSVAGFQGLAQDPFSTSRDERAVSSLDSRHNLVANFVWTIPVKKSTDRLSGRLLSGWQATGIVGFRTGQPFTAVQQMGYSPASSAVYASAFSELFGSVRPFAGNALAAIDTVAFSNAANSFYHFFLNATGSPFISPTGFIIADGRGYHAGSPGDARFIYNDFAVEQAASAMGLGPDGLGKTFAKGRPFGDVGRNTLVGPNVTTVDFAILKNIKFSERVMLQLRAELYNMLNHPNHGIPNSIVENAGGFGFLSVSDTDASPRQIRLGAKLTF